MRYFLDVALILVAGFVIASYLGLMLVFHGPAGTPTLAIVEISLDWALLAVAAVGCMQKRDPVTRRALTLLLVSNLVSLAANYQLAFQPTYQNGDPVDILWFSAWILRWVAARMTWLHYGAGHIGAAEPAERYRANPFFVRHGGRRVRPALHPDPRERSPAARTARRGGMLLGGILILRQFAELDENRRLFRAQIERESRFTALVRHSSDVVIVVNGRGSSPT